MTTKTWILFAALCLGILGGLVWLSNSNKVSVDSIDPNAVHAAAPVSGNIGDHAFGKKDSKVVLIEYGDFQCPGCSGAYVSVNGVKNKYKDQMVFVFRNLPLSEIHPNARFAATAAEAVGLQSADKYWAMVDKIYANQKNWQSLSVSERQTTFTAYAEGIGADKEQFVRDLESEDISAKIKFDKALAQKAGVANSTPAFILNGRELTQEEWGTQEALEKTVVAELKKHNIPLPEAAK